MPVKQPSFLFVIGLVFTLVARAELTVAPIFADGAVIQADAPVTIWGKAAPGAVVSATLGSASGRIESDDDGNWELTLPAISASPAEELVVSDGEGAIVRAKVALGDVWLVMGRLSNWQPLANGATVDCYRVDPENGAPNGNWRRCTARVKLPAAAAAAVAQAAPGRPVGVVILHEHETPSPIEAWLPRDSLENIPDAKPILAFYAADGWNRQANESYEKRVAQWLKQRQELPLDPPPKPKPPKRFDARWLQPGARYDHLLEPLTRIRVGAILFEHGSDEYSLQHAAQYGSLLTVAVDYWRERLGQPMIPVYVLGAPAVRHGKFDPRCGAELRESQVMAGTRPNVHVVPTFDLGSNPTAQALANRLENVCANPPVTHPDSVVRTGDVVQIDFPASVGLRTADGKPPRGFIVAESRWRWLRPTETSITGNTVTLTVPGLAGFEGVRYAYQDLPSDRPNLIAEALPVHPFRTDNHPRYTDPMRKPDDTARYFIRKSQSIETPGLPRVLIVGDSISGGYQAALAKALHGIANVVGEASGSDGVPPDKWAFHSFGPRCYTSANALRNNRLSEYLARFGPFDYVLFNMGIHEFAAAREDGSEKAYANRLRKVVAVIRESGGKPLWVSSTGTVADNRIERFPRYLSNCRRYNAAADIVMADLDVPAADLFGLCQSNIEKWINQDLIHFSEEGKLAQAHFLAEFVRHQIESE